MACPCGSQLKSGLAWVGWIDQAFLDAIAPSMDVAQWKPVLAELIGQPVTWGDVCAADPPAPPTPSIDWFTDPFAAMLALLTLVRSVGWPIMCECIACPPLSDCTGGDHYTVDHPDGQLVDADCSIYEYVVPTGSYYVQVYSGTCYHLDPGFEVRWIRNASCDSNLSVSLKLYGAAIPTATWYGASHPTSVEVYVDGTPEPPNYTWPDPPVLFDPIDPSPVCSETLQCDTLDWLSQHLLDVQYAVMDGAVRLADQGTALGSVYDVVTGISGKVTTIRDIVSPTVPYSITLPGLNAPITGTIATVLNGLVRLVAPATPGQLVYVSQTSVTDYGFLDVTGMYAVLLELTTVPDYMGYHDREAREYYTSARNPGPGWATMSGPNGVIERMAVREGTGQYWILPSLATIFTYDLQPGVTLSVTYYQRQLV